MEAGANGTNPMIGKTIRANAEDVGFGYKRKTKQTGR